MSENQKPYKEGFKFPVNEIKTKITEVEPNHLSTRGYKNHNGQNRSVLPVITFGKIFYCFVSV